jgi:4-amino-4-deoxy-L-arabinose transferase-like glycosyltransferase
MRRLRPLIMDDTGPTTGAGRLSSAGSCSHKALVAGTLGLFVLLGFCYSMVVPPFEKPDEPYHYAFAQHLAGGGSLPVQSGEMDKPWGQEGSQPPLYYWSLGRLISGIDLGDNDPISKLNPYANIGTPLDPGNKNRMLYSAASRPIVGTNLAVHIGRWFSLLAGAVTLWLIYRIARLVFPGSALMAWLVLATVAMVPQFAFISSSVSNDSLVILCCTAVIYWLARLVARPDDRPFPRWEWLALGVMLGLAALSKLQGLGLVALIGIAVIGLAWRRRSWALALEAAVLVLAPAAVLAGWWYARNYRLYGDWFGVVPLFSANGLRDLPQTWGGFLGEMRGLRYSFWGLYGWFNILLPQGIYRVLDVLSLLALAGLACGLAVGLRRRELRPASRPDQRILLLLGIWTVIILGTVMASSLVALTSQGRLTYPALSAFGVLWVAGLAFWLRLPALLAARTKPRAGGAAGRAGDRLLPVLAIVPLGLLLCSLYSLTTLLPRSYHPQPPVLALPDEARSTNTRYADHLELVGVRTPAGRFRAGQSVPLTLYWRTDAKLSEDYPMFVQLLDENRETIANITSHPGWGRNPTSLWQPGVIYPDTYELAVPGGVSSRAPLLATLYVGFLDPAAAAPLPATDEAGAAMEGMVGRIPLVSSRQVERQADDLAPVRATFGDSIRLSGAAYPSLVEGSRHEASHDTASVVVRLLWEADGQPRDEYTAFVHLVGPGGDFVAGFDRPPADHGYATGYWQEGDRFLSDFTLNLPVGLSPGIYQVWAGLYSSDSQGSARLPVQSSDRQVRDDRVLLGLLEVK